MNTDAVLNIGRQGLFLVLLLSALPLLVAMGISLLIGIFQAATQIQENTLPTVPRLVAVYVTVGLGGMWMLRELVRFSVRLFDSIGSVSF